jgi:hypothetical protein
VGRNSIPTTASNVAHTTCSSRGLYASKSQKLKGTALFLTLDPSPVLTHTTAVDYASSWEITQESAWKSHTLPTLLQHGGAKKSLTQSPKKEEYMIRGPS